MSEKSLFTVGKELWGSAKSSMATVMSPETFSSWFAEMDCVSHENGVLTLGASSDFAADWIRDNYSDVIKKHLCLAAGENVDFIIASCVSYTDETVDAIKHKFASRVASKPNSATPPVINPRNTFENFIVGEGNSLAHAAALAVAKSPGSAFNPLCLYSSTGLGKTHLMHAVAHFIFLNNQSAKIVYLSSERFVNEFIKAIQDNELSKFRDRYRSVDVLMVDDVQFFSGKERCQTEFFHAFNDLFNAGKQIILSSDRHVSEIPDLEQRLVSRFEWGMPIDIQPPDYETRLAILSKKAKAISAKIPPEVLDLLARRITKNVRRMEGALNRLVGYVSLISQTSKKLDVETAEKLLCDTFLLEESSRQTGIELIQKKTAEYYKLDVSELVGPRRPANIALARQIAMYLARKLTSHSLQEIGQLFGGRNHGTVMHAISSVTDAMEQDENLKRAVDYLQKTLSN